MRTSSASRSRRLCSCSAHLAPNQSITPALSDKGQDLGSEPIRLRPLPDLVPEPRVPARAVGRPIPAATSKANALRIAISSGRFRSDQARQRQSNSGTFLNEAIRALIQTAALHARPRAAPRRRPSAHVRCSAGLSSSGQAGVRAVRRGELVSTEVIAQAISTHLDEVRRWHLHGDTRSDA